MSSAHLPPTITPAAAARWHAAAPALSPWLHEEVGRRMEDRLQWLTQSPAVWCHWDPVRGGLQTHGLLTQRYPEAQCVVHETAAHLQDQAQAALGKPWWSPARWAGKQPRFAAPEPGSVQMLWANMVLHMAADPEALLAQWHEALAVDGFLMFSCLGPDTAGQLHALYARHGWPPAGHSFTDMHDWGDMLVHAGFAEPVMDMEQVTLTFATPQRLLQELRELGCNLHPQRFAGLRGRQWRSQLEQALGQELALAEADGQLALSFEVVYGHAFKPTPRMRVGENSSISLDGMRAMLKSGRNPGLR